MTEIWINHLSVYPWQDVDVWRMYLDEAQNILCLRITHLDASDPVRRQYLSSEEAGTYICDFGSKESGRHIFGKCASGVEFSIHHSRRVDQWCNDFKWYVPKAFIARPENCERLKRLFDLGNATFKPFYAYADALPNIKKKEKIRRGRCPCGASRSLLAHVLFQAICAVFRLG